MTRAFVLLCCAVAVGATFPEFSWDTIPVFWHSANSSGGFSPETAAFAARFPLVTIEKFMAEASAPEHTGAELKIVEAARQIKSAPGGNTTRVLFYLNSIMDWDMYDLHAKLKQLDKAGHSLWLYDKDDNLVQIRGQNVFDLSNSTMRQMWIDVLVKARSSGVIDGAFADRGTENATWAPLAPGKQEAYNQGHAQMMIQAQQAMGGSQIPFISNNGDYQQVSGRMFERFAHDDFDHNNLNQDIAALQHEATMGHIAEVHGGEPCNAEFFNISMAAFLIGAGEYAYYACTEGWDTSSGWMVWHPEYDYPLGKPTSQAMVERTTEGAMTSYKRSFASGTTVSLQVGATGDWNSTTSCIEWSNGKKTGNNCD
eukprot:m.68758 g.68758  ORF g.68758 m.68758 type:complete len:369 (-) comp19924_c0_seq1:21-1127(-)